MNKIYYAFAGFILVLFLSSCGSTQFTGTRPGSGQKEFSNDFLECKAVSVRLYGHDDVNTLKGCMQGKGWAITTSTNLL